MPLFYELKKKLLRSILDLFCSFFKTFLAVLERMAFYSLYFKGFRSVCGTGCSWSSVAWDKLKYYVYWTVHHLTSWINWTNLMSLNESFYCSTSFECYYIHPQEPATVCRYIVLFRCVLVYWLSAPTCIRIPPYSSRTAPIHQYTPKQNNTPTYSRRLLRMNVITFETCWAIKTFVKWHLVGSIYSTSWNKLITFPSKSQCFKVNTKTVMLSWIEIRILFN